MDKERFSLLLLDPGEIYFEDFRAVSFPPPTTENDFESKKEVGRLKMCSKSLVFDPKDLMKPIVKIALKDCERISKWDCNTALFEYLSEMEVIAVECSQHAQMLQGNVLAPYTFITKKHTFLFLLNYAKLSDCLPQISQLHRASTLPAAEQNTMIATIVYSRQARFGFDTLWLDNLYEQVILETQASKITPLVVNPGRVLLTSSRLYFQPYNNIESFPVLKIRLHDIKRIVKRRFLLRQVGLEVYCSNDLYLTLKTTKERDDLYESLLAQPELRLEQEDQQSVTLQWQNGVLSNYDYLLYLNSSADRTFNDLTQYPVFPWIICDYTSSVLDLKNPKSYRDLSKPMGALDPLRLDRLRERYNEMSEPKFLYGSHYSTPGFVLFYLVRKYPHYMLCLQNGRFDHPDRMFNSVPDVWNNVIRNMSDFKELVPEFYDTQSCGDFCLNTSAINFGHRHDGSKVGNVKLPAWAEGPEDFVGKLRQALESDYVSNNLHLWIDLIFGFKQSGHEALKANNVFYYLCYEGAVDLDSVKDLNQRHALEVQIMEFGQIPKQIFQLPHPRRHRSEVPSLIRHLTDVEDETRCSWRRFDSLTISTRFKCHKDRVCCVALASNNHFVVSVGQDSLLKIYSLSEHRQVRSISLSNMALSDCILLPDNKSILIAAWDNSIILYNMEFGRVVTTFRAHEDAVTRLVWGKTSGQLVSGSWDCSVRIWSHPTDGKPVKVSSSLQAELQHDAHLSCLALNSDDKLLVTGTEDGELVIWSMSTRAMTRKLPGHMDRVNAVSFSPDDVKLVSCGDDCNFQVLDPTSGMQIYCKSFDQQLKCLAWDGCTLLLGGGLGTLYIWDLIQVTMIKEIQAHSGPLTTLAVATDGSVVVSGGEDHQVLIWQPNVS